MTEKNNPNPKINFTAVNGGTLINDDIPTIDFDLKKAADLLKVIESKPIPRKEREAFLAKFKQPETPFTIDFSLEDKGFLPNAEVDDWEILEELLGDP